MATTLALPACVLGTVDEPTTEEASTATLAAALDIGDAFCSWYYACDCNPGLGPHRDEQECRLFVSTEFTRRLEQGSNADLEQDDRCYDDIVAYFESAQCADANDVAFDAQLRGALDLMLACKPWSGGAIEGQSCTPLPTAKGDDCAPGLACDLDFEVCVPSVLIPEGDACGAMSPPCEPGLTCASTNDDDERCMRLPLLGDPCDGDECSAGLWCPPDSQTCAELPAAGASCVPGGNAYEWACRRGSTCVEGSCALAPGADEPCDAGSCATGLTCSQGRCVASPALVCDLEVELP